MMDISKIHKAFLSLLHSGLWDYENKEISIFPLTDTEWKILYRLSREQTVTGLIFAGIQKLPENIQPKENLLVRWIVAVDAIERSNLKMNSVLVELCEMFKKAGINPVLLKGQGIASLYKNPLLRECGDIDFYFPTEKDFISAKNCIHREGIRTENKADESMFYFWKGVKVEHHKRMFDLFTSRSIRYSKELEKRYDVRPISLCENYDFKIDVPHPVLNIIQQSTHILKHAVGLGIGLRQFCDLAISYYTWYDELADDNIRRIHCELGLEKWYSLELSFLEKHIRLSGQYLPCNNRKISPDILYHIVWSGGNFGQNAIKNGEVSDSFVLRKMHTAWSFYKNISFAYKIAPKEAFGLFIYLIKGQLK
jgi:hypothetical protein